MKIFNNLDAGFDPLTGCVVAVGNFDGVHRGHQLIFEAAVRRARDLEIKAVLLTFSRHPAAIIRPDEAPHPLMAVPDRLNIAGRFGFDAAFVLDFDPALAALPPEDFVTDILVNKLNVKAVVAGQSWRFGHGRKGDMAMIGALGRDAGIEALVVEPCMVDGLPVSSTRTRAALAAGDVAAAAGLMGRPHFVRGTVVHGRGKGRDLGFPTVNLDCGQILVPGEGVYAGGYLVEPVLPAGGSGSAGGGGSTETGNGPAAVSIGSSPTFDNGVYAVEGHLVGLKDELYGATVAIAFLDRLREQRFFASEDDLARQIALDVEKTVSMFSSRAMKEIPF